MRAWCFLLIGAGCGRLGFDPLAGSLVDARPTDDGERPDAELGAWGAPQPLTGLDSPENDWGPAFTPDVRTLYFHSNRPATGGGADDIYVATRPSRADAFGPPVMVTSLATGDNDKDPTFSRNGTRVYFVSSRGSVDDHVFVSDLVGDSFTSPVQLVELGNSWGPAIVYDDLELFYTTFVGINRAVRADDTEAWTPLGVVPELAPSVPGDDGYPSLSSDGLTIYFESDRDTPGAGQIFTARRIDRTAAFSTPVLFDPANLAGTGSSDPDIAADDRELVFGSDRPGGVGANDLYLLTRGQ